MVSAHLHNQSGEVEAEAVARPSEASFSRSCLPQEVVAKFGTHVKARLPNWRL